jgi:hypothetical protein
MRISKRALLAEPGSYSTDEMRRLRPNAHPNFWSSGIWRKTRGKIFSDPALRLLVISSPLSRGVIARFAGERLYL